QLSGKPGDLSCQARDGPDRRPRLDFLYGPRAGAASVVRLLCSRVHEIARDVQHARAVRSCGLSGHGRADVRAEGRSPQRPSDRGPQSVTLNLLFAVALALGSQLGTPAPSAPPALSNRILVMPFENVTRNGRIFWLAEASAV